MKSIGKVFLILFGLTISICTVGCGGGGGGGGGGIGNSNTASDLSGTDSSGQMENVKYIKAVSLPVEITEAGVVAALLAKNTPNLTNKRLSLNLRNIRTSIKASTSVSKDSGNVYTITSTNYPGESDYDPSDAKGAQTIKIRYLNAAGVTQAGPGADTVKAQIDAEGNSDYDVLKYENARAKYVLTNPDSSKQWLTTSVFSLEINDTATVTILNRAFAYQRTGSLLIDAISGKATSGTVTDSLTQGGTSYTARHTVTNGYCNSTYQADGKEYQKSVQLENFTDKTVTYSWINPLTSNAESAIINFSGSGISLAKADNDRLNHLYTANPFVLSTPEGFAGTAYARIFRHACNNDTAADAIVSAATQAYPNNIANQFYYCIGFETKGLKYETDDLNFGAAEYVCLPAITLYNKSGDCEDRAILLGALMHKAGFDTSLILLHGNGGQGHAIVGVVLPSAVEAQMTSGSVYYTYNGKRYYCLEATNFISMNEIKPWFDQHGYSLMAIIPANVNLPVSVSSIKETLRARQ